MTPDQLQQLARDLAAAEEGGGRLDERLWAARGLSRRNLLMPSRFWPDTKIFMAGGPSEAAFVAREPQPQLELVSIDWSRLRCQFSVCVAHFGLVRCPAMKVFMTGATPELAAAAASVACLEEIARWRALEAADPAETLMAETDIEP